MTALAPDSDMVSIQIRTGSKGTGSSAQFRGLSALRNKIRLMDGRMTWVEAFQTYFKVVVDPKRFVIQRSSSGSMSGGKRVMQPTKHDLREEINVLIGEFKRVKTPFLVFLLRRGQDKVKPRRGPVSNTVSMSKVTRNSPRARAIVGTASVDVKSVTKKTNDKVSLNNFKNEVPKEGQGHKRQGSQTNELRTLATSTNEDNFKSSFCKRAQRNITNTQFLKAQRELDELKHNFGAQWGKWTTYAPTTANIDLFNV